MNECSEEEIIGRGMGCKVFIEISEASCQDSEKIIALREKWRRRFQT